MAKPQEFYEELAKGRYLIEVRRFVPFYDEMISTIIDLLRLNHSRSIIDLGCGLGNVEEAILETLPNARVSGIELSPQMANAARERLARYEARAKIVTGSVTNYTPEGEVDAVISNIALHNIELSQKEKLIMNVNKWLKEGGIFVWADLIKYKDTSLQRHFVNYRKGLAKEQGAQDWFIEENFAKEGKEDHPLTIRETFALLEKLDFNDIANVLTHDTFAVFCARKK